MAFRNFICNKNSLVKTLISSNFRSFCAATQENIQSLVKKDKVVVFMKGVPENPRCGFSNAVVQILRMHGVEFQSVDVLADDKIRQGIKEFSSWPTIPQIYMNGEFVGGCDILMKMHQSGDLIEELKKINITSALLKDEKNQ